jgi:hypothetical protein
MGNSEKIINAFKGGDFPGSDTKKPKHIITTISNVFVCGEKTYKIYKSDSKFFNDSFNDLSIKSNRFSFTRKDFEWNNNLSPEIYLELKGVFWNNNEVIFTEPKDDVDDLVIVMNKIDISDTLFEKLRSGGISLNDCYEIGMQFGKRILSLPGSFKRVSVYENFISLHKDLIAWIDSVNEFIPKEEATVYLNILLEFIKSNREYFEQDPLLIGPCLDIHADNVLFVNNRLLPIDTYSPKENWLSGYKYLSIYRLATDVYAFLGKEYFDEILRGYVDVTREQLPRNFDKFLILYCELIACPYQYTLSWNDASRLDIAKKYHKFLKEIVTW